jgi:hypothetical protein
MRYCKVGVFAADVYLAERILRYAGQTQKRFIKLCVFTLRLGIKPVWPNGVTCRAKAWHNIFARDIQFLALTTTVDTSACPGCEVVGLGEEVAAVWEKTMLCVANKAMNVIEIFLVKFNCR